MKFSSTYCTYVLSKSNWGSFICGKMAIAIFRPIKVQNPLYWLNLSPKNGIIVALEKLIKYIYILEGPVYLYIFVCKSEVFVTDIFVDSSIFIHT